MTERWSECILTIDFPHLTSDDFRLRGTNIFDALRILCELVERTIFDALSRFDVNNHVNSWVVPKSVLEIESHAFMDDFVSFTASNVSTSLPFVRETLHTYSIQTLYFTNSYL